MTASQPLLLLILNVLSREDSLISVSYERYNLAHWAALQM